MDYKWLRNNDCIEANPDFLFVEIQARTDFPENGIVRRDAGSQIEVRGLNPKGCQKFVAYGRNASSSASKLERMAVFPVATLFALISLTTIAQSAPTSPASPSPPDQSLQQPRCKVEGSRQISIVCGYSAIPVDDRQATDHGAIALNHAELSFKTNDDAWMSLDLTLTRLNSSPIVENHLVYIEIDDEAGSNYIRRPLPNIKLAELAPGKSREFREHLYFPALQPGRYRVKLWMPSADPAYKFAAAHNLLVSSVGVADEKSGLNTIAAFSVTR